MSTKFKNLSREDIIGLVCEAHGTDPAPFLRGGHSPKQVMDWLDFEKKFSFMLSTDPRNTPDVVQKELTDAREKFRAAAGDALCRQAGISVPQPSPGFEDFLNFTPRELARECLRRARQPINGSVGEMVGRSLTSSDFPSILADVANKALFDGFAQATETFEAWTGTLPAANFKALNVVSISALDGLLAVSEHGEYKYGFAADKGETITLGTAGRIYPISRTAIVNDELGIVMQRFRDAGRVAKKYEGDLVYAVLTTNAAMGEDSKALFHADHGNIGTNALPDVDSMNEMDALFGAQTGINSEALNIPMEFLIAPRGLWGSIEAFFAATEYRDANNVTIRNIWFNRLQRIYDSRLTGTAWYCAGPKGTTVVRTHLDGVQIPYTEIQPGWKQDAIELKVRYDVAAGAVDWRGLAYNAGR